MKRVPLVVMVIGAMVVGVMIGVFVGWPSEATITLTSPSRGGVLGEAGSIRCFLGEPSQLPGDWIPCDGRRLDKNGEPRLHAKVRGLAAEEEANFVLPDFSGLGVLNIAGFVEVVPVRYLGLVHVPRSGVLPSPLSRVTIAIHR